MERRSSSPRVLGGDRRHSISARTGRSRTGACGRSWEQSARWNRRDAECNLGGVSVHVGSHSSKQDGEVVERIKSEDGRVARMLGGPDGRTLLVATVPNFDPEQCAPRGAENRNHASGSPARGTAEGPRNVRRAATLLAGSDRMFRHAVEGGDKKYRQNLRNRARRDGLTPAAREATN